PVTTELYTLSLHDALPISDGSAGRRELERIAHEVGDDLLQARGVAVHPYRTAVHRDVVALRDAGRAQRGHRTPRGGQQVHGAARSEEHTSELQSRGHLVCR